MCLRRRAYGFLVGDSGVRCKMHPGVSGLGLSVWGLGFRGLEPYNPPGSPVVPFTLFWGSGFPCKIAHPKTGCPYDKMVTGLPSPLKPPKPFLDTLSTHGAYFHSTPKLRVVHRKLHAVSNLLKGLGFRVQGLGDGVRIPKSRVIARPEILARNTILLRVSG